MTERPTIPPLTNEEREAYRMPRIGGRHTEWDKADDPACPDDPKREDDDER